MNCPNRDWGFTSCSLSCNSSTAEDARTCSPCERSWSAIHPWFPPPARWPDMGAFLSAMHRHRDLLFMLTWRDIRIKYKQSVMGFMWALLMPALIVSAGLIVKVGLATVSGRQLQISQLATVTLKALPWAFFVGA